MYIYIRFWDHKGHSTESSPHLKRDRCPNPAGNCFWFAHSRPELVSPWACDLCSAASLDQQHHLLWCPSTVNKPGCLARTWPTSLCMIGAILFFLILHTILNQVNLACSFLGLRFVLFSKDVFVEGHNILADFDHGAQFDQKSSTPKESQSKTQLVSFQERFHFAVNDPIAATCSDLRNPSLPRSSFSPPSQSSNVYFDDSSMEMLWMQTTQEAYRHALCYMQPSMAHGDRSHVCPWSQEESARPECLLILAGQSTMASAMGSTWRTCANSETEVKATYSQEPTHPSRWTRWTWWTSTTSCTHDARSPTAWRGHGAHDPHESNDGVEHAAHEYDANTVPSGALCTALASTRDTLASLNTRSTSHHAAQ